MIFAPTKPPRRSLFVLAAALFAVAVPAVLMTTGLGLSAEEFARDGNTTLRAEGYAFAIWGVIYLGMIAYAVWQVLPSTRETPALKDIAWPSVVAMAGCALWIAASAIDAKALTVLIIVTSAATLIAGLRSASAHRRELSKVGRFLIFWPLGLLAGWLTIASAINILTVATAWGWITPQMARPAGLIGIVVVLLIGGNVVWRLRHLAYGLPISWGLVAVWVAERDQKPQVALAALGAAVILLIVSLAAGRPSRARLAGV